MLCRCAPVIKRSKILIGRALHVGPKGPGVSHSGANQDLFPHQPDIFSRGGPSDDDVSNEAMRVTVVGAAVNVCLAAAKIGAGYFAGSTAIIADGVHSLSDLVSDALTAISLKLSRAPADDDHPYGHGKIETLASGGIALLLLSASAGLAYTSYLNVLDLAPLWGPAPTAASHPSTSSLTPSTVSSFSLQLGVAAAVASIGSKEALYRWTHAVGVRARSQVLISNAWHHRTDALSSVVALVGVGGLLMGFPLLDPLAGVIVSSMIAKVGLEIGWQSVCELTDRTVDSKLPGVVSGIVSRGEGVLGHRRLRTRRMGHYSLVDVEVKVAPTLSVSAALQIANAVRSDVLSEASEVSEVLVHVYAEDGEEDAGAIQHRAHAAIEEDVRALLPSFPQVRGMAHFRVHYLQQRAHVEMEVELVDLDMSLRDANAVARQLRVAVETIPGVSRADIHLETDDS